MDMLRAYIVPIMFACGTLVVIVSGGIDVSFPAVASLSIFIPQEMVLTLTLLKIFLCALIAFVAFGYTGFRAYAVSVLFLMLVSFVFSGLMLCVWLFAAPMKMLFINGTVYFGC